MPDLDNRPNGVRLQGTGWLASDPVASDRVRIHQDAPGRHDLLEFRVQLLASVRRVPTEDRPLLYVSVRLLNLAVI